VASVYDLKPKFQSLLRPLCAGLAARGVTANQITILAALMSLAEGAAVALTRGAAWALMLLPVTLFGRMALNALDGMLAREFNQKSRLGAVLNELGDVVSDTALYLPFALIPGVAPAAVALFVCLAVTTEMAGVVAIQIGASRRYDGPFGKSDRAVFFGTLGLGLAFEIVPPEWTDTAFLLAAAASLLTILNRARAALAEKTS
jgi:CDP-diacylglycerol--glycerol-3-phosphate 3-phosphatidyltransferase